MNEQDKVLCSYYKHTQRDGQNRLSAESGPSTYPANRDFTAIVILPYLIEYLEYRDKQYSILKFVNKHSTA